MTAVTTILVVDDEPIVREVVVSYLRREGYRTLEAGDGELAKTLVETKRPDLVVLDLMLPGTDGLSVCRWIRAHGSLPIIMLTARGEEADRIVGLELGADDYVTKPFSPRELVARVRAVLRRADPPPPDAGSLEVGDLAIDLRTRRVTLAGAELELRTLEFELLAELARNAGQVVTRDRLFDRVWGGPFAGGTRTVDVHVAQLRKKLGRPELIRTVRGYGYRLLADAAAEAR